MIFFDILYIPIIFLMILALGSLPTIILLKVNNKYHQLTEFILFSNIVGLAILTAVAAIAFELGIKQTSNSIVLLIIGFIGIAGTITLIGSKKISFHISKFDILETILFCLVIFCVLYVAQIQPITSDLFAHLGIVNQHLNSTFFQNCDGIIGEEYPNVFTYGCSPWHYIMASGTKQLGIEIEKTYTIFTAYALLILFISMKWALSKHFSNRLQYFAATSFAILILLYFNKTMSIEKYTSFELSGIIFPFHFASLIFVPILIQLLILIMNSNQFVESSSTQFNNNQKSIHHISLVLIIVFLMSRFHPGVAFWVLPLIFAQQLLQFIVGREQFKIKSNAYYTLIILLVWICGVSLSFACENVYHYATYPKLHLWRTSGGGVLEFRKWFGLAEGFPYIANPITILKDTTPLPYILAAISLIWSAIKSYRSKELKEINYFYLLILIASLGIIFNPIATWIIVEYASETIVFRVHLTFRSSFAIICAAFLVNSISKYYPRILVAIAIAPWFIMIIWAMFSFNKADGYRDFSDLALDTKYQSQTTIKNEQNSLLVKYLKTLPKGKIVINEDYAPIVAAFTNVDPIIAQQFRMKSPKDYVIRTAANSAVLTPSSADVFFETIKTYKIDYIAASPENTKVISDICNCHLKKLNKKWVIFSINKPRIQK